MTGCTEQDLMAAIRAKCMDCSGHSRREVERCRVPGCPLYPLRLGTAGKKERQAEARGQIDIMELLQEQERGE